MLESLKMQPADKIMALMSLYAQDKRLEKIDLGVGVYKNQNGQTPIMAAVKEAEEKLLENQSSKSYVGLLGSLNFVDSMIKLTIGQSVLADRVCGAQAPGGTGALHQLFLLLRVANPSVKVWVSNPSWPNHNAILKHLRIESKSYRYFDETTCTVSFDSMIEDLKYANSGDVLLLHGCCHNPTGANLDREQWNQVTNLCLKKRLLPLVDIAYQGFGEGLDEDAYGLREMASRVPEMMVGASCSKNFGIYRDRVGVAIVIGENKSSKLLAEDNLKSLNRLTYSFPPDHGASVVDSILRETDVYDRWSSELDGMRTGMLELRSGLAKALKRETNSSRFDFIETHRGMFSRLGLGHEQVVRLRENFGIYMVSDSRINIAGLQKTQLDFLASAIATVL